MVSGPNKTFVFLKSKLLFRNYILVITLAIILIRPVSPPASGLGHGSNCGIFCKTISQCNYA